MPRTKRTLANSDGNTLSAPRLRRASNGKNTSNENTAPVEENTSHTGKFNSCAKGPHSSATSYELRCVIVACHLLYGSSFAEIERKVGVPERTARDVYRRAKERAECEDLHKLLVCVGNAESLDGSASTTSEQAGNNVQMEDQFATPRHKRKLGGSDDVSSSAPRPKRMSYGKTTLEDNAAPEEEDNAPVEENTAPTEENTSPAGEKAAPVEEKTPRMRIEKRIIGGQLVVIVHDGAEELPGLPADASPNLIAAANNTPEEDDMTKRVKEKAYDANDDTWICVCRSKADMRREHPEVGDKTEYHPRRWNNCMCSRFADRNPEHKWIFTKKGMNVCRDGLDQTKSRDQVIMGVFVFNRWNSYAVCEVVENMLAAFNKAVKSPNDWFTVWAHTEGLGRFLQFLESDFAYYYDNGSEGNAKRLMLIGTALLSAIDVLKSHNLFSANDNTEVRNIGLILCHYLQFAYDQRETPRLNEAGWTKLVIQRAEEYGIRIEGFYGIEKVISALKRSNAGNGGNASDAGRLPAGGNMNMVYAYQSASPLEGVITVERVKEHEKGGTRRDWGKYDLKKETAAYRRHQMVKVGPNGPEDYGGTKIGGMFYDLTGSFGRMLMREQMKEAREKEREAERIEKEKRRVEREAMWAAKRIEKEAERMKKGRL